MLWDGVRRAEAYASMKILVVEDDRETADYIAQALRAQGHRVALAGDGGEALRAADQGSYDVAIVDRMLPGVDGLTVVKNMREQGSTTGILFLTNLGGIDDRVEGLEAGGDDYLVKPFAMAELLARVNALARRKGRPEEETVLTVNGLVLDRLKRTATRNGRVIDLQPREFKLLEYLMQNAGRVVTRKMLLQAVWDFHFDPMTNIVETHVSRLRTKIDRGFERELIHTIRGSGYSLYAPQ